MQNKPSPKVSLCHFQIRFISNVSLAMQRLCNYGELKTQISFTEHQGKSFPGIILKAGRQCDFRAS